MVYYNIKYILYRAAALCRHSIYFSCWSFDWPCFTLGAFINPLPPNMQQSLVVCYLCCIAPPSNFFVPSSAIRKEKTGNIILFRSPPPRIGSSTHHGLSINYYLYNTNNKYQDFPQFLSARPVAPQSPYYYYYYICRLFVAVSHLLYRPIHTHNVYLYNAINPHPAKRNIKKWAKKKMYKKEKNRKRDRWICFPSFHAPSIII